MYERKKKIMRTVHRTYSIPEDVDKDLRMFIGRGNISHFITEQVRKGIAEAKEKLKKAYLESKNDPEEKVVYKDFECTMRDGLGDDNGW
jgi:hypothetical protein